MTDATHARGEPGTVAALAEIAAATTGRRRARQAAAWCLAGTVIGLVSVLGLDALIDLASGWRLLAALALVAAAGLAPAWWLLGPSRLRPTGEAPLRLAEDAAGDRWRLLTASHQLAAVGVPAATLASDDLRARFTADGLDARRVVAGLPAARLLPALAAGFGAAALFAAVHLPWPHLLATTWPRLVDPFGDHPPFSLTRLTWEDTVDRARPGDRPTLAVRASGRAVSEVRLRLEWPGVAEAVADLPLSPGSDGRWSLQLPPLPVAPAGDPPLLATASAGGTRSTRLRIALDPIPVVAKITVRHASPGYARLDEAVTTATPAAATAIDALAGSRVRWEPAANRPLAALLVQRQGDQPREVPLDREGGAWIDDPAPGRWSAIAITPDGRRGDAMTVMTVSRRIDQPPTVRFASPSGMAVATPDATIPLAIEAADDLGLSLILRYRLIDGKRTEEVEHPAAGTGDTWRGPLVMSGVAPGQTVTIGAMSRDTCPPDGQWSKPAVLTLRIISGAEWNAMVRDQLEAEALLAKYEPLLKRIAELEAAAADPAVDPAQPAPGGTPDARRERLEELARRAAALRQEVAAMHRDDPLFPVEPDIQKALERRLAELEAEAKAGRKPPSRQVAGEAQGDLEELTARAHVDALAEALENLAAEQERLAAELKDLASRSEPSAGDRARLRAAAQAQAELEEDLAAWNSLADATAKQLDAHDPALAAKLRSVAAKVATAKEPMAASSAGARRNQAASAAPPASKAAEILRRLVGSCSGGSCPGGMCRSSALSECQAMLMAMAMPKLSQARSRAGRGSGMTGAAGAGLMVSPGGRDPLQGRMPLYGPEPILSRPGGNPGGGGKSGEGPATVLDAEGRLRPAPAHERGDRRTTAGTSAPLSPGEMLLLDDYYRRLEGDPLAPPANRSAPTGGPR